MKALGCSIPSAAIVRTIKGLRVSDPACPFALAHWLLESLRFTNVDYVDVLFFYRMFILPVRKYYNDIVVLL